MADPSPLLTVNEVATLVGVHPKTIYAWVRNGTIPYLKVAHTVRFSRRQIDDWLEANSRGPATMRHIPGPVRCREGAERV